MHETHLPRSDSLPTKIGGSAGAHFTTLHPKCALQAPRWKVAWSKCMRMSCLQRFQQVSLSVCFVGRCFMCSAFFFACHNSFIQFNGNMQIYHIFIYSFTIRRKNWEQALSHPPVWHLFQYDLSILCIIRTFICLCFWFLKAADSWQLNES